MRVEKRDGSLERKILIGMVVHREVLARISEKWEKDGLFRSKWSNIVGGWCVKHFRKYGDAPKKSIEAIFDSWSSNGAATDEKDTVKLVEKFLAVISDEYEAQEADINRDYLVDAAAAHFNKVKLEQLAARIQGDIERGKPEAALERAQAFKKVEMGASGVVDVLSNQEAMRQAFEDKKESIVVYPGALGQFFGDSLERDAFIAFMAPDKTGKSFWVMDLAFRALLQRRKVALFECGDMSQNQVMRRLMTRIARRPMKPTRPDKPVRYPIKMEVEPDSKVATVDYDERHFKDELGWREAWAAAQKVIKHKVKSKESYFKLSVHPAGMISVRGIRAVLEGWEREGWTPDVIAIDYADLLAPLDGKVESIHQINQTWEALRALSQALHCLVVTATQSNAAAYEARLLTRKNFSGNKMKLAHVTGMIGINQTGEEKDLDVCRLGWVVLRDAEFSITRCVHVAGCRPLANIAVKSTF